MTQHYFQFFLKNSNRSHCLYMLIHTCRYHSAAFSLGTGLCGRGYCLLVSVEISWLILNSVFLLATRSGRPNIKYATEFPLKLTVYWLHKHSPVMTSITTVKSIESFYIVHKINQFVPLFYDSYDPKRESTSIPH
jgi:hypothetical protein